MLQKMLQTQKLKMSKNSATQIWQTQNVRKLNKVKENIGSNKTETANSCKTKS